MNGDYANDSERVFAGLCRAQGYGIEKIPEDATKQTPDFKVISGAVIVMAVRQIAVLQQAPWRSSTAGSVLNMIAMSCQSDQFLTYQASSWTRRR